MRNTLLLLVSVYLVFLDYLQGVQGPKSLNPLPVCRGPPFIDKGAATMAHRRLESYTVVESILWNRRTNAFNALLTCPSCFIVDGEEARPSCRRLAWLRRASELMRRVVPRLLAGY